MGGNTSNGGDKNSELGSSIFGNERSMTRKSVEVKVVEFIGLGFKEGQRIDVLSNKEGRME